MLRNRANRNSQDYGDSHFAERTRRRRIDEYDDAEPMDKRQRLDGGNLANKNSPMVIGPRIRPRLSSEDEEYRSGGGGGGRRLQSRIVSSGKEKSREEVLAEQSKDKKGRDRNKRMFGALLGTLQRFKQEETKLKAKEEKRAQIEAKLDEAAKKERDEVRTKRTQLIRERKLRITEIKRLEIKRNRLSDLAAWESKTKYLANFIRTEAKPHIFYMPKKLNPIMECRLEQSKQYVTELIASKRKLVLEDLEDFEQRSKRYWERRLDGRETRRADPMDEDIEEELKEIMKTDDLTGDEDLAVDAEVEGEVEDFKVTVFTANDANEGNQIDEDNDVSETITITRQQSPDLEEEKDAIKIVLEPEDNGEIPTEKIIDEEDDAENGHEQHNDEENESPAQSENEEELEQTVENDDE
ncbi:Pinin [Orchesella cincta]|uniref:Pinin n=1 Tax=Orchesella cincta TaxID=48709 RepID=A0A1D2NGQ5_ORCCI|nr:Pinin [Orchesella cincta]